MFSSLEDIMLNLKIELNVRLEMSFGGRRDKILKREIKPIEKHLNRKHFLVY